MIKLDDADMKCTKGLISYDECLKSLTSLPNRKPPGIDGLTTDFHNFVWNDINTHVLNSINYAFENGKMSKIKK